MARFTAYFLRFRSPLHVGERGVGLEETRIHVPADTLFSAVCSSWRLLYGAESLVRDLLDWYPDEDPSSPARGNEPFFLGSAFPFAAPVAGPVRFFPRPLGSFRHLRLHDGDEKAFKRVRFLSEALFRALCSAEPVTFRKEDLANGGTAWLTPSERTALGGHTDDATGDLVFWKTAVVPRVTLDRVMSASQIWHFGELHFARDCGLWFPIWFNPEHGPELRLFFEASLRLLGDTGLGGERGAGRGLFDWRAAELDLPELSGSRSFVTLAPVCPSDSQELARLLAGAAAYELLPRRGWISSPEGSNLRRKMVWMLAEGSVLEGPADPRPGRLVDVTPDVWREGTVRGADTHKVWRYGYAFPVACAPGPEGG